MISIFFLMPTLTTTIVNDVEAKKVVPRPWFYTFLMLSHWLPFYDVYFLNNSWSIYEYFLVNCRNAFCEVILYDISYWMPLKSHRLQDSWCLCFWANWEYYCTFQSIDAWLKIWVGNLIGIYKWDHYLWDD